MKPEEAFEKWWKDQGYGDILPSRREEIMFHAGYTAALSAAVPVEELKRENASLVLDNGKLKWNNEALDAQVSAAESELATLRASRTLAECLESLRDKAQQMSGMGRGMASAMVKWHPYEDHWIAQVDWSDDSKIVATGPTPIAALQSLREKLEGEQ